LGVRIARKHVGWYLQAAEDNRDFRQAFNQLETAHDQVSAVAAFFASRQAAA
jgi:tRNA-dihydrouridine synthase B